MAEWQTVRFDPAYDEPLDPEIIPLLDAMNAAGFVTTASCSRHGTGWPLVVFEHSTDERIERLARFIKSHERADFQPSFTMIQKEILEDGYVWTMELHLNNVFADTLPATALLDAIEAINRVAGIVARFPTGEHESSDLDESAAQQIDELQRRLASTSPASTLAGAPK